MDEKATQLHAIASLKVLLDATKPQDGANGSAQGGTGAPGGGGPVADGDAHDSGRASQGTEVGVRPVGPVGGWVAQNANRIISRGSVFLRGLSDKMFR